jgi:aspartyl-tRNA(Asn)/glutamyl-tRNA(Gln) amidotransferase subunit A
MKDDLFTISKLQETLLSGECTVVSLVERYLSRIKAFDSSLNAFITVTENEAYEQAKRADAIISEKGAAAFEEYPLLGVVVSYKDVYLTKGVRTTAASKVLEDFIPPYSATVVDRVQNAGAIMIGKLNCDAWAHGGSGENSDFGPSKNPWNTSYVPGGSSSGSAVSVSANFSHIAFGTDTGGSIRLPASFCNVVGFKPTYGAVPRYGVVAMASSLDTMGHFAHSVEDIEKVFTVTRGPDGHDGSAVAHTWNHTSSSSYKIGIPHEYFVDGIDVEVRALIEQAKSVFSSQNVTFVPVSLPHTKYALSVYYIVQPAEVSSNLGRYDGVRYGNDRATFGAEAKRRIMLGTYVLSSGYYDAYYLKASKVRTKLIEDFDQAFTQVDAILSPVSATPAFKLGEKSSDPMAMYLTDIYTVAANLVGIPGLALPAGFTSKGLPVGFQLLGPRFSEHTLFDLGKLYQAHTDFHLQRPTL